MSKIRDGLTRNESATTGKVTWTARWTSIDAKGKRRYHRRTFPTRKLAQRHLNRELVLARDAHYLPPARQTLGAYVEAFYARKRHIWTTATAYTRGKQWERYIGPSLGHLPLADITRARVLDFMTELHDAGLSNATVRNIMAHLLAILNGAVDDEILSRNPAKGIELPANDHDRIPYWTADEARTFLQKTVGEREHALYYLLLTTGIRIGEALALRWEHVDLDAAVIRVMDTLRRQPSGAFRPEQGTKTGRAREIDLTDGCVLALSRHKARQDEERAGVEQWDERGFVFSCEGSNGRWMDSLAFRGRLDKAIEKAGLRRIKPHGFRHTAATLMLSNGVPELVIQDVLGHSTREMIKRYAHIVRTTKQVASERIGEVLDVDVGVLHATTIGEKSPENPA